jgi:3-deoxy-manno-octulosonate cytidylyltransferase (CMP-KDO synthetase)
MCAAQKIVAMIPARYAATRFPAKLMQVLGDKTVIRHTYENTAATGLFDEVVVVTDHPIIYDEIVSHGGKAVMSKKEHESGSDRIAEAAADMAVDIVVNVQGDEPFLSHEPLAKLVQAFQDPTVQIASLMRPMQGESAIQNPNSVKVVVDKKSNALYFSRSVIPYPRSNEAVIPWYLHIGVYAFRKKVLLDFTTWPVSALEATEKLEQLRYLENGIPIRMVETNYHNIAIDTPEDLEKARQQLS